MFLIAIDQSGRLLVEQVLKTGAMARLASLPKISDNLMDQDVASWLARNGLTNTAEPIFFDRKVQTDNAKVEYVICCVSDAKLPNQKLEFKSLESLWHQQIDQSIALALNQIVRQVTTVRLESVDFLEEKFVNHYGLKKVNPRVFFAQSQTVEANESMISFLGAFSVTNGHQTARLCLHIDQTRPIQEMLMIHAEPISTGPLRQAINSSVSYHMLRGALEITLHYDKPSGDVIHCLERKSDQPSVSSSLRVPAKVFRTIRTLTDSAVFVEVQSGPFSDSDTEWKS